MIYTYQVMKLLKRSFPYIKDTKLKRDVATALRDWKDHGGRL